MRKVYVKDLKPGDVFIWGNEFTRIQMCIEDCHEFSHDPEEQRRGQVLQCVHNDYDGAEGSIEVSNRWHTKRDQPYHFDDTLWYDRQSVAIIVDDSGFNGRTCHICGCRLGAHQGNLLRCPNLAKPGEYLESGWWNKAWAEGISRHAEDDFFATIGL